MRYSLCYHEDVVREDIPRLPKTWRIKIQKAIATRLMTEPDLYGVPLRRSLIGYRKLRVSDYRVVYLVTGRLVKIFTIRHRKDVYEESSKRTH